MIVYKYAHPDRIDVLKTGLIRFTQADALNDPFEINPNFSEYSEGARAFAKKKVPGEWPSEDQINELLRESAKDFRERLFPQFLILSLSQKNNNALMWSHYAASHSGIVYGFDAGHPFFSSSNRPRGNLMAVEYSKERYVLPRMESWNNFADVSPAFLRKSDDWAYEEEWRMFARSSAASSRSGDKEVPIYLFDYPKECLTEVILGVLTKETVKREIVAILETHYPHVKIFQAKISESTFDLDICPYAY